MNAPLGEALAAAACALVGTPFRLHGRDPATGLDCIGVLVVAMAAIGRKLDMPVRYGLRNTAFCRAGPVAHAAGLRAICGPVEAGHVLMLRLSAAQAHLMIASGPETFIHAHAGLRRVVASPAPVPGPLDAALLYHWQLADLL